MTNDLRLIHTQGLDEGIRCAMCTNTMKSDKGCDGGCVVDQKMYEKVLKVIDKALEAQPTDTKWNQKAEDAYWKAVHKYANKKESQPKTSYISVDLNKFAKEVAEKVLDEITYEGKTIREWVEIIVKQQQTDADCISRSELLRHQHIIYDDDEEGYNAVYVKDIKALPSVTPSYNSIKTELKPCEDCISRQAVIDYAKDTCLDLDKYEDTEVFCDEIKALPSVYPERPKGKWIQNKDECDGVNFYDFSFECSKCGKEQSFKSNYCPNCGAYMRGGVE